mgnify:CR=1 FL=1
MPTARNNVRTLLVSCEQPDPSHRPTERANPHHRANEPDSLGHQEQLGAMVVVAIANVVGVPIELDLNKAHSLSLGNRNHYISSEITAVCLPAASNESSVHAIR